jgi:hypothetical protein
MFTRRVMMQIGAFGLGARYLAAAEAWEKKTPAEWDAKDIEKLMNKSPWAKKFPVDTGRGPAAFSGVGAPKGSGGGGGGRGGPQGGGGDLADDGPPGGGGGGAMGGAPEALVRWETAVPILEAQKRQLPEPFRGNYAISIAGFPLGGGPGGPRPGGPGAPGGAPNLEAMRAAQQTALDKGKDTTWLERKGKDPIHPAIIAPAGRAILLIFPQTQPIQIEDKDVTLVVRIGVAEMKAKFHLKDMLYQGKLEL